MNWQLDQCYREGCKFERNLAEAQNLLKQCLSAMPVGYIPTHTEENLPEMIGDLAKALAEETTERENLERERDEALSDLEFRRDLFKLQEQQLNDVRAERDEARETAERYRLEANAIMMQRDVLRFN
jgi:hypothetical protein